MNRGLANLIGRPDLGSGGNRDLETRSVTSDQPGFTASAAGGGDVMVGRISAGTLGLLVLGLVGFYVWTKGHQR